MAALLQRHEVILDQMDAHHRDGVTFGHPSAYLPTTVTIAFGRWVEMGYPSQIKATIEPVWLRPTE